MPARAPASREVSPTATREDLLVAAVRNIRLFMGKCVWGRQAMQQIAPIGMTFAPNYAGMGPHIGSPNYLTSVTFSFQGIGTPRPTLFANVADTIRDYADGNGEVVGVHIGDISFIPAAAFPFKPSLMEVQKVKEAIELLVKEGVIPPTGADRLVIDIKRLNRQRAKNNPLRKEKR